MSLVEYVRKWQGKRVLVLGDLCTDLWLECATATRHNPEGGELLVLKKHSSSLGMAGAVHEMVSKLGGNSNLLPLAPLITSGLLCEKTRIQQNGRTILRVDNDRKYQPLRLPDLAQATMDLILVCDHGKGTVDEETMAQVMVLSRQWQSPVIVDPAHGVDWKKYQGATAIKCNHHEWKAIRPHRCDTNATIIVTDGSHGCRLIQPGSEHPILTKEVPNANVIGAGDAFLSGLGLAHVARASWPDACKIGNTTARLKCMKPRTEFCTAEELIKELEECQSSPSTR